MSADYIISNQDRNVSEPEIKRIVAQAGLAPNTLAITKIFTTFQGEMPYAGTKCVFIRLAGCNRGAKESCAWCDTEFSMDAATLYSPADLWKKVYSEHISKGWRDNQVALIVITGGEPGLQTPGLADFFRHAISRSIESGFTMPHFQFECNGDYLQLMDDNIFRADGLRYYTPNHFTAVISPKAHPVVGFAVNNSYPLLDMTCRPPSSRPNIYLRCVISGDQRDAYYQVPEWLDQMPEWLCRQTFLSPITVFNDRVDHAAVVGIWDSPLIDRQRTAANYKRAQELAMEHNYRLSCQTHLLFAIE